MTENNLRMGDLVCFQEKSRTGYRINHVGIYLSKRSFIHATLKAGVIISSLDEAHWCKSLCRQPLSQTAGGMMTCI